MPTVVSDKYAKILFLFCEGGCKVVIQGRSGRGSGLCRPLIPSHNHEFFSRNVQCASLALV